MVQLFEKTKKQTNKKTNKQTNKKKLPAQQKSSPPTSIASTRNTNAPLLRVGVSDRASDVSWKHAVKHHAVKQFKWLNDVKYWKISVH